MLNSLIERDLAERVARRPGQKEDRFVQRLGGDADTEGEPWPVEPAVAADPVAEEEQTGIVAEAEPAPADDLDVLAERVAAVERSLSELRSEVTALRRELGG